MIFSSPLSYYRAFRAWSREKPSREELHGWLRHPWISSSQNARALAYLLAKRFGVEPLPPLAFAQLPRGGVVLDPRGAFLSGQLPKYAEAVDLLFLWKEAGLIQESQKLAEWLLGFGAPPIALGYLESEYCLEEQQEAYQRLTIAYGPSKPFLVDADFRMVRSPHAFFTLQGWNSPLGSLDLGEGIHVRALAPEELPLRGALSFGLSWIRGAGPKDLLEAGAEGVHLKGWTATYPSQIWMEIELVTTLQQSILTATFREPLKRPLAFAFYLTAASCEIGGVTFFPRSLHRYQGEEKRVFLQGTKERRQISSTDPLPLQLIPLAGKGAFWDTDFLLAFEVPPHSSAIQFKIGVV